MLKWYQQKSSWAAMATMLTGAMGFWTGVLTPEQTAGIMAIFGGLTAIFVRQGVEKSKPEVPNAENP